MRRYLVAAGAGLVAGAAAVIVFTAVPAGCTPGGLLDQGTLTQDGVMLAVVHGGCGEDAPVVCTIGDGAGEIAAEVVPRGVHQDCVVFNQYLGVGLPTVPGYLTGECFTYARVEAPPRLPRRELRPRRRCRG